MHIQYYTKVGATLWVRTRDDAQCTLKVIQYYMVLSVHPLISCSALSAVVGVETTPPVLTKPTNG